MKKIKYLLFFVICTIGSLLSVQAASFNVSANATSIIVGNTVKVSVTVSGNEVGAWTYCLNYDSSKLTFLNSTANGGGTCVNDGVVDLVSRTATYTFKAKASGTSTVSLSSAVAYDYNTEQPLQASKGSVKITARTQAEIEASYSTNANLKALRVDGYEISPEFKKDVLEYSVEVPNDVELVNVIAALDDSSAHASGAGEISLSEGINKVIIVVTAEKGNKKEYVLNITRKELDPIYVEHNGQKYTVIRKSEVLEAPNYYSATMVVVDDTEVPAFKSDITSYTLVGLKDDEGNIKLYRYDSSNEQFFEYIQFNQEGFTFIPEVAPNLIESYDLQKQIVINDQNVTVYYKNGGNPNFVIIYGMNAATGKKEWYQYDLEEGTFQRFQSKEIIELQENLNDYFLLVIVFSVGLGLSIILIITLLIINSRAKKKNVKLLTMLENGQVVEKNYVIEEVENDFDEAKEENQNEFKQLEENEDNEQIEKFEEVKKEKKKTGRKKKEAIEELEDEIGQLEEKYAEEVEDDNLQNTISLNKEDKDVDLETKEETIHLSRRELNRLEKQKQKDLQEMEEEGKKTRRSRK